MRSQLATQVALVGAIALGVGSAAPAAVAAADDAVKRAIVTVVLQNLGVEPTDAIVGALVENLPVDSLKTQLVNRVSTALDSGSDLTQIVTRTIDTNNDGRFTEDDAQATGGSSATTSPGSSSSSATAGDDTSDDGDSAKPSKGSNSGSGGSSGSGSSGSSHEDSGSSGSGSSGSGSSGSGSHDDGGGDDHEEDDEDD